MQPEQLPVLQKTLVAAGNRARKPVIIATEMLGSMVYKPRPTRAELTDVGNAVLDGADATLLSDETAIGGDPARAVRFMSRILHTVEKALGAYDVSLPLPRGGKASRPDWAIADAAVEVAAKVQACAIIAMTGSGRTARLISASRPSVPLFTYSPDAAVRRRISILWGVNARPVSPNTHQDRLITKVLRDLRKEGHISSGERVVVAFGSPVWAEGTKTNTVRVEVVP
jgi:pyruvate kinase